MYFAISFAFQLLNKLIIKKRSSLKYRTDLIFDFRTLFVIHFFAILINSSNPHQDGIRERFLHLNVISQTALSK